MPAGRGKMTGVINNGNGTDRGSNEMSYVDMHDLHPENVQAAQLRGFMGGAGFGAMLGMLPAFFSLENNSKAHSWKENTGLAAIGALITGMIGAYTAKKEAETHNAWSERVLGHMEEREAAALAENRQTPIIEQGNEVAGKSQVVNLAARREAEAARAEAGGITP
jgi:hypothetical protein